MIKDRFMPDPISNDAPDLQRVTPHPFWIPLHRAPFRYRYEPDYDGSVLREGFDDAYLEMLLRGPGIVNTKIYADAGEFELSFEPGVAGVFNFPLRFHPSEVPSEEILKYEVRMSTAKSVEIVWQIMREQFGAAVHQGLCTAYGRRDSVLNDYTSIASSSFRRLEVPNWIIGDARTPTGELIFDLYVAPASGDGPMLAPPKGGSKSRMIYEYLLGNYHDGIPIGLTSEALFLEINDTFLERGWPSVSKSSVEKMVRKFPRRM
jgi:hypothetical protein